MHPSTNKIKAKSNPQCKSQQLPDQIQKWNVKFDKGIHPIEFVERVDELAQIYAVNFNQLTMTVASIYPGATSPFKNELPKV